MISGKLWHVVVDCSEPRPATVHSKKSAYRMVRRQFIVHVPEGDGLNFNSACEQAFTAAARNGPAHMKIRSAATINLPHEVP